MANVADSALRTVAEYRLWPTRDITPSPYTGHCFAPEV